MVQKVIYKIFFCFSNLFRLYFVIFFSSFNFKPPINLILCFTLSSNCNSCLIIFIFLRHPFVWMILILFLGNKKINQILFLIDFCIYMFIQFEQKRHWCRWLGSNRHGLFIQQINLKNIISRVIKYLKTIVTFFYSLLNSCLCSWYRCK